MKSYTFTEDELFKLIITYKQAEVESKRLYSKIIDEVKTIDDIDKATPFLAMYKAQEKKAMGMKEAIEGLFFMREGKFPSEEEIK
jgi:hypothetical protein